jgi:tetratricopeptide (TPR) repeat protein
VSKRWTEADTRFLKDNYGKMNLQALAGRLEARIDEVEKKIEALGLKPRPADDAQTKKIRSVKEMSRYAEAARRDYERGVTALQKKKVAEAERYFSGLIAKYPEETELVDRARVYLAVCEKQKQRADDALTDPEDYYYAAIVEKNRGNVEAAIEHLKKASKRNGEDRIFFLLACCYAQRGDAGASLENLRRAIEADDRNRVLARHDRDFDPLRALPDFQNLLGISA